MCELKAEIGQCNRKLMEQSARKIINIDKLVDLFYLTVTAASVIMRDG